VHHVIKDFAVRLNLHDDKLLQDRTYLLPSSVSCAEEAMVAPDIDVIYPCLDYQMFYLEPDIIVEDTLSDSSELNWGLENDMLRQWYFKNQEYTQKF
jgi:hypothetical protein